MRENSNRQRFASQRGQTLALVAVSMVALLGVAALAIDLTSLYAARGEIQRAADGAALAGAKALVDSGVTTDPTNPTLQNLAQTLGRAYANGAAAQNLVAGAPAQFANAPVFDFSSLPGNPRIYITLQRTGLPLFFARIWGGQFASVSASAIGEAYNPAYSQANTTSFLPSAPKCVKPFLVPNNDNTPGSNPPIFVDPASGAPVSTALALIGHPLPLANACRGNQPGCNLPGPPNSPKAPRAGEYLPMLVGGGHQYCPNLSSPGCTPAPTDFQQSIQCCDGNVFTFPQCGSSATLAAWDPTINPSGGGANGPAPNGLQCLMHTTQGAAQQDTIDTTIFVSGQGPMLISPGPFNQARYGLQATDVMATSDSIITVPLFDNSNPQVPANVTIVGFLQLFVTDVNPNGNINTVIMNISGCGQAMGSGAVSGGGVSAIPVRLVRE